MAAEVDAVSERPVCQGGQDKADVGSLLAFGSATQNLHLISPSSALTWGGEQSYAHLKAERADSTAQVQRRARVLASKAFPKPQARRRDESCLPTQEKEQNQMPPSPLSQGSEVPFLDVSGGSELVNQNTQYRARLYRSLSPRGGVWRTEHTQLDGHCLHRTAGLADLLQGGLTLLLRD